MKKKTECMCMWSAWIGRAAPLRPRRRPHLRQRHRRRCLGLPPPAAGATDHAAPAAARPRPAAAASVALLTGTSAGKSCSLQRQRRARPNRPHAGSGSAVGGAGCTAGHSPVRQAMHGKRSIRTNTNDRWHSRLSPSPPPGRAWGAAPHSTQHTAHSTPHTAHSTAVHLTLRRRPVAAAAAASTTQHGRPACQDVQGGHSVHQAQEFRVGRSEGRGRGRQHGDQRCHQPLLRGRQLRPQPRQGRSPRRELRGRGRDQLVLPLAWGGGGPGGGGGVRVCVGGGAICVGGCIVGVGVRLRGELGRGAVAGGAPAPRPEACWQWVREGNMETARERL